MNTCKTCRFSESWGELALPSGNLPCGTCRRFPPTLDTGTSLQGWPSVKPDDWCGEFKLRAAVNHHYGKLVSAAQLLVFSDANRQAMTTEDLCWLGHEARYHTLEDVAEKFFAVYRTREDACQTGSYAMQAQHNDARKRAGCPADPEAGQ